MAIDASGGGRVCFGMIGAGGIARSQHLPNIPRAPHVRLKTICDLDPAALKSAQAAYGIPHAVGDAKELLADPEIVAVIVATREDAQAPLTIAALKAGKHVYVEKPLAVTAEAFRTVIKAWEGSGKRVAVGFNRRFAPAYRKVMEVVRACGGPKNIYYRISDTYTRGWGRGYPPGSRLYHEVCHVFDVLRWLTGSEAESVYCVSSRPDDEMLTIRFKSGCVAAVMNSGYGTPDLPKERLEIVGENGGVTVEEFVEVRTFGRTEFDPVYRFAGHSHPDHDAAHVEEFRTRGAEALYALRRGALVNGPDSVPHLNYRVDKGWIASLDGFAAGIIEGEAQENATPRDAYAAHLLADAAGRSRESGHVERLQE